MNDGCRKSNQVKSICLYLYLRCTRVESSSREMMWIRVTSVDSEAYKIL